MATAAAYASENRPDLPAVHVASGSASAHPTAASAKVQRSTGVNSTLPAVASGRTLGGVAVVSATLLMTELALTRIFSVIMYYHFAFLAISIALFGLSASGVFVYLARRRLDRHQTDFLLSRQSCLYGGATIIAP